MSNYCVIIVLKKYFLTFVNYRPVREDKVVIVQDGAHKIVLLYS
jgi:hypothetical protein